jgi:hypothetical protein
MRIAIAARRDAPWVSPRPAVVGVGAPAQKKRAWWEGQPKVVFGLVDLEAESTNSSRAETTMAIGPPSAGRLGAMTAVRYGATREEPEEFRGTGTLSYGGGPEISSSRRMARGTWEVDSGND